MSHPSNKTPSTVYLINPTTDTAVETASLTQGYFHTVVCLEDGEVNIVAGDMYEHVALSANGSTRRSTYVNSSHEGKLINNDVKLKDNNTLSAVDCDATQTNGDTTLVDVTVTRLGVDVTDDVTAPEFDGIDIDSLGQITDILPIATVGLKLKEGDVISFPLFNGVISFTIQEDDLQLSEGFYLTSSSTASTSVDMLAGQTIQGFFTSVSATGTAATDPIFLAYK